MNGKIMVSLLGLALGAPVLAASAAPDLTYKDLSNDNSQVQPTYHLLKKTSTANGASPLAQSTGCGGVSNCHTPAQIVTAYQLNVPSTYGAPRQTIAVVTAYDAPTIANDLAVFDANYGLIAPPSFNKVYATGSAPAVNAGWAVEASLDVEWAHTINPSANIVLVEAASSSPSDLSNAVQAAEALGATEISMSWGISEATIGQVTEQSLDSATFYRDGTTGTLTYIAAAGDSGNGVLWPAASLSVVSVGGTSLYTDASGNYLSETVWSNQYGATGGGISQWESPLASQNLFITGNSAMPSHNPAGYPVPTHRAVPDVAMVADPATGVAIYDSTPVTSNGVTYVGWQVIGGTSAGTPIWAGIVSLYNQNLYNDCDVTLGNGTLAALYNWPNISRHYVSDIPTYSSEYHDLTTGSNGTCGPTCTANAGYDELTGTGTPNASYFASKMLYGICHSINMD